MDFPHLDDTKFPLIDNVNVYKYQNNFDYARWNGKVSIKLLNVLWNSNYADVPYFNSVKERDEWFDAQDGYVGILESLFNNTPENTVKIPIPYNDAYKYNYLVVDMPMQTSADNPINYEDSNIRIKRWFYFIDDMIQFAPSATELQISVDYWTTFIHSVEIPYLMLERGHAPMMQTKVADFLTNPIMNNEYLLADDFNYGNDTIIQTSNYVPIGNGKKYILFCAPYRKADFSKFDGTVWSGNATGPTYENTSARWGYQIKVNDYQWKYGNTDYSGADLPINNMIQTGIFNGCECFAIEGTSARAFFNEMAKNHVNFIHGIQAMFMLDESLFTRSDSFEFNGYTIYIADRKINNLNLSFDKAQFGFDSKYAEITKLYTFPYSSLEISDDEGNSFTAKIENCGRMQMHTEVSLVYPFLNYNVFVSGINGDGTMNYKWESIQGTNNDKTMWASDFSKFMMNWNVPVYTIYVSAETEYAANNAAEINARRSDAIKDYENAVRYANTTKENTADSFSTNTSNVAASGATNTDNVNRSTSTMVANMSADMATMVSNNKTACDTATANITKVHNVRQANVVTFNNDKIDADARISNSVTYKTTEANNEFATATYGISQGANLASSMIGAYGGMLTGASQTGLVGAVQGGLSGVIGMAQALPQVQAAGANLLASISTSQDIADITAQATAAYAQQAILCNSNVLEEQQIEATQLTKNNNDSATEQTGRTAQTNNADASRTKTAQDTNASATQATNNANAGRTQTTETNNATYTRNATIEAEKANLVQKQKEAEAQYKKARLQAPAKYSSYSGDFAQDVYQRRGVRFNIRTQSKSAIAQAGDAMLRFGYALHRVWDMSNGFHYGKEFTFWKAEDIWINDGSGVANIATNAIGQILMKGVTVWRNPEKIGSVRIYDNI